MKYKAKEYAMAIAQAKKFNLQKFLRLLEKNGDTKKMKEIVALVEKMKYRKVVIETARTVKTNWRFGKHDKIEEKISPELLAGVRITINGETQLDFSLKNKLDKIFTV